MRTNKLLLVVLVFLGLALWADLASATTLIDDSLSYYAQASATFGDKIKAFAIHLLLWGFFFQLVVKGIQWMLKTNSPEEIFGGMVMPVISIGWWVLLIQGTNHFTQSMLDMFISAGQTGSGLGHLSPSSLITLGIQIQDVMVAQFNQASGNTGGLLDSLRYFFPNLMLTVVCVVILTAFAIMAFQMALIMIAGYFWLAVAPLLFGFGSLSFTKDIAMNALKGGIAIGMKYVAIYFIAGVAQTLAVLWGQGMGKIALNDWSPYYHVAIGAAFLAYLAVKIPQLASDLMNGTASMSAGDVGQTIATGAAAGVGAAAGGLAMAKAMGSSMMGSAANMGGFGGLGNQLQNLAQATSGGGSMGMGGSGGAIGDAMQAFSSNNAGLGLADSGGGSPGSGNDAGSSVAPPGSAPGSSAPSSPQTGGGGSSSASGSTASGSTAQSAQGESAAGQEASASNANSPSPAAAATNSASPGAVPPPATLGNEASASIQPPGGDQNQGNKDQTPLHQKIRNLSGYLPDDGHSVGLSANINSNLE